MHKQTSTAGTLRGFLGLPGSPETKNKNNNKTIGAECSRKSAEKCNNAPTHVNVSLQELRSLLGTGKPGKSKR